MDDVYNLPKYLILELKDEIPAFERVVCGIEMPTVDMDACLEQIFYVISEADDSSFRSMIANIANYMGKGEGLYENARLDEYEQKQIIEAVIKVGTEIKAKLDLLKAIIDGYCPYSFKRLVGKNLVILSIINDEN
jgi:hypothetical protein